MIFDELQYEMIIESILFVSGKPVHINDIAKSLNIDVKLAKTYVKTLLHKYIADKRGIIIIEIEDSYQMCTNPIYFEHIKKIYKTEKAKTLSQTAIETLAIIAYKQPVTKSEIEHIRGVNCDHIVNRLVEYNLVCEKGRQDMPGKPILFGTTDEFLKYFGFNNLEQLPNLPDDIENIKQEALLEIEESLKS